MGVAAPGDPTRSARLEPAVAPDRGLLVLVGVCLVSRARRGLP